MKTEPNTKRKKQVYDLSGKEYIFIGKENHKPDENENNSDRRVRLGKLKDTSCLGEKHNPEYVQKDSTLCKKERCGGVYLTGQNSCKDIISELRSKTFKTDLNGIDDFIFRCGYRFCCDELERLLKEKEND